MKLIALSLFILCAAAIWPAPQSYTHGNASIWVGDDVNVTHNGRRVRWYSESFASQSYHDSLVGRTEKYLRDQLQLSSRGWYSHSSDISSEGIVELAIQRAFSRIFSEGFTPWKLYPRNEMAQFEPSVLDQKIYLKSLTITQSGNDKSSAFKPLAGETDESYILNFGADGTADITAISYQGVLRALDSFTQLWYSHSKGAGIYTNLIPLSIIDAPRYSHRGLNLDVSRNWYPKSTILHLIDALSWNKFNRFHIHMTDGQSWPMDIPAFPELSAKGAYQTGLSYSPSDIEEILVFGLQRGVEVYIEFDMPGHTSSIALAYPDLIAAFDQHPWDSYCAEPPCGTLKLNSTAVSDFLEKLFDDVLPRVSRYSSYFHTGGDEINANAYMLDETVKSNDSTVLKPLLQKFVNRNHDQLRKYGLAPVGKYWTFFKFRIYFVGHIHEYGEYSWSYT